MSNFDPPPLDINLLGPGGNPQEPKALLAPTRQSRGPNAWHDVMGEIELEQQSAQDRDLMRVFQAAVDVHPDLAAESERMGVDLELDTRMVEENVDKVRKTWELWTQTAKLRSGGSWLLQRQFLDPQFARTFRDDIETLGFIETWSQQWNAGDLGREKSRIRFRQSQNYGILSPEDQDRLDEIDRALGRLPVDSSGLGLLTPVYGLARMTGGMWDTFLHSLAASAAGAGTALLYGQLGPQAGLPEELITVPVASFWAGLTALGVSSGQQITGEVYGSMRELGLSHEVSEERAEWAGVIGGALEAGSMGLIFGKVLAPAVKGLRARALLKPTSRLGALGKGAGAYAGSIASEEFTELAQEWVGWAMTDAAIEATPEEERGKLRLEDRGELSENLKHVFWETLRGVAILASFGPALQLHNNLSKAVVARNTKESLERLRDTVKDSKGAKRSPDRFLRFLEQAINEGGGPKSFFFDIEAISEQMQEADMTMADLEAVSPEVAQTVRETEAEGLDTVEIPAADFGAKFLVSDFGGALIPHAMGEPGGKTALEGVLFESNKKALSQAGLEILEKDAETSEKFKAEAKAARKRIYDELIATGATPREAATESTFYSHAVAVRAKQMGMTPAEFEAKHGLEYLSEADVPEAEEGGLVDVLEAGLSSEEKVAELRETAEGRPDFDAHYPEREAIESFAMDLKTGDVVTDTAGNTYQVDEEGLLTNTEQSESVFSFKSQGPKSKEARTFGLDYEFTDADAEGLSIIGSHMSREAVESLEQPATAAIPVETKSRKPDPADLKMSDMAHAMSEGGEETAKKNVALFKGGWTTQMKAGVERKQRGYDSIKARGRGTEARANSIIEQMVRNLETLFDMIPKRLRDRSRKWYEGANRLAQAMADRYGLTLMQTSGILASLSPQADWRMNVSYAERMLDALTTQARTDFTPEMGKWIKAYANEPTRSPDSKKAALATLKLIEGKRLGQLTNTLEMAYWIRAWDETTNEKGFRNVAPEGTLLDIAKNKDGSVKDMTWTSMDVMSRAIDIYMEPTLAQVSKSLGVAHKVRNFYNNIFDPNHELPFATVDTHQVAGNLLLPLGSDTIEVKHSQGKGRGASKNAGLGLKGTYWIYHEALIRAAANLNVKPRELQSVTWEATRALFDDDYKRASENPKRAEYHVIRDLWRDHHNGKRSYAATIKAILKHRGALDKNGKPKLPRPEWASSQPGAGVAAEAGHSTYEGVVPPDRLGRRQPRRVGGRVASNRRGKASRRGPSLEQRQRLGLFSALRQQFEKASTKVSDRNGWIQQVKGWMNKGLVKEEEVFWLGLEDFFEQPGKIKKEAILEFLDSYGLERLLSIEELGEPPTMIVENEDGTFSVHLEEEDGRPSEKPVADQQEKMEGSGYPDRETAERFEKEYRLAWATSRHESYKLHGGKNYRELLLTLPSFDRGFSVGQVSDRALAIAKSEGVDVDNLANVNKVWQDENGAWWHGVFRKEGDDYVFVDKFASTHLGYESEQAAQHQVDKHIEYVHQRFMQRAREELTKELGNRDFKYPAHWPDHVNVVVHIRVTDRVGKNGERVLFVEEIQSDWGQEGKKHGWFDPHGATGLITYHPGNAIDGVPARWQLFGADMDLVGTFPTRMEAATAAEARGLDVGDGANRRPSQVPTAPWVSMLQLASLRIVKEEQEYTDRDGNTKKRKVPVAFEVYYGKDNKGKLVKHSTLETREAAEALIEELNSEKKVIENTPGWIGIGMRHLVANAVVDGYDQVAFATGEQSAAHYSLRDKVDRIEVGETGPNGRFDMEIHLLEGGDSIDFEIDEYEGTVARAWDQFADTVGKPLSDVLNGAIAGKVFDANADQNNERYNPYTVTELDDYDKEQWFEDAMNAGFLQPDDKLEEVGTLYGITHEYDGWVEVGDGITETFHSMWEAEETMQERLEDESPSLEKAIVDGEDLELGGEGMMAFYDLILPAELKKMFGKKGELRVEDYQLNDEDLQLEWDDLPDPKSIDVVPSFRLAFPETVLRAAVAGGLREGRARTDIELLLEDPVDSHMRPTHGAWQRLAGAVEKGLPELGLEEVPGTDTDLNYVFHDQRDKIRWTLQDSETGKILDVPGRIDREYRSEEQAEYAKLELLEQGNFRVRRILTDSIGQRRDGEVVSEHRTLREAQRAKDRLTEDDPDDKKAIGPQNTLSLTDKLVKHVDATGGNLALFASGQRGRYHPQTGQAVLGQQADAKADASTVFHEMLHHFVSVAFDIANGENPPAAILEDVDTMLRWFKIAGETPEERLATWNAMTFKQQAPHHEAVSYNYELWLFTGKAPTVGLRKIFERIRTFMIGVYTSLTEAQRQLSGTYKQNFGRDLPEMTKDIREMFERMVAGEQSAQKIEAVRELAPLFQTLEAFTEAGFDASQWAEYQRKMDDAKQELVTDLTARSMRAMQWQKRAQGRVANELRQKHTKRRARVRKEIAERVAQEPIYRVFDFLKEAKGGVDRDAFRAMLSDFSEEDLDAIVKRLGRKVRAKGGLHPDELAELFAADYPSGKPLVDEMVAAWPIEEEIDRQTDAEMQRVYGYHEAPTEEAIEEEVERAVHNEARARFVAAELKFLDGATKPARIHLAAAQEAARRMLARRKLNDISPTKFARLEDRAAAAAAQSMRDGKPEEALEHKHRQLLYNQLAKQALEFKEEFRKAKDGVFRRVGRGKAEDGNRDANRVHLARTVLSMFGLVSEAKAEESTQYLVTMSTSQVETLEELYETQFEPILAEQQEVSARAEADHRNMTVDEFRVMREQVESMFYHALRAKQMRVAGKQRMLKEAYESELEPTLTERAREPRGQAAPRGVRAAIKDSVVRIATSLKKVEHYNRELDGGEQGGFTRILFREVKEALNRYRADAVKYTKTLVALLDELRADGHLDGGAIPAPELGALEDGSPIYTFGGNGTKSSGIVELVGALLHMGNASNKSKFLVAGREGYSWADVILDKDGNEVSIDYTRWNKFIENRIKDGTLTRKHFEFVQNVWNLMEDIKPLLQRAHVEMHGHAMPLVKHQVLELPVPFKGETEPATFPGGYVPAAVDYEAAARVGHTGPAELSPLEMDRQYNQGTPKVAAGLTKGRIERYRKRPLTMDIGGILRHIDQSMRYAHVAPAAIDMGKMLTYEPFREAMARVDEHAIEYLYKPFLDRAVTQSLYVNDGSPSTWSGANFFKYFRRLTGIKIMAGNVVVALQQFTGLTNALIYVKARHMKGGLVQFMRRRGELVGEIKRLSSFMDDRLANQMFELSDDMRRMTLSQKRGEKVQHWAIKKGYLLQSSFQNVVDIITWQAAYEQAMESPAEGLTLFEINERAVQEADQVVRLSQGSFSPEDVAGYEKGSAFFRTWTQFSSYFNTVLNQLLLAQPGGERAKAAVFGFALPMLMAEAIAYTLYDKWDDEDDDGHIDAAVFMEFGTMSLARGALAMSPGFGMNASNWLSLWSDRPVGDRVVAAPTMTTGARAILGVGNAMLDSMAGETPKTRDLRDAASFFVLAWPYGGALGAPLLRPLSYAGSVLAGEVEPTSGWDTFRGGITGYASKDSRR